MTLAKGDKAPDFSLYSSEKKEVQLNDFDGKNVVMGKTEVAILESFIRNVGLTVSKESLENMIYQDGYALSDNALQVAVHRVRKKLSDAGAIPVITTIRGIGYLFK